MCDGTARELHPETTVVSCCVPQAQHLLHQDGLFVGSSAAMNCVGAVKVARQLGPGHTIVTILCDAGHRRVAQLCDRLFVSCFLCFGWWLGQDSTSFTSSSARQAPEQVSQPGVPAEVQSGPHPQLDRP